MSNQIKKQINNIKNLNVLGLSDYEAHVFTFLQNIKNKTNSKESLDYASPLVIARHTQIPRASVYFTLGSLEKRGLVKNSKVNSKSVWHIESIENISNTIAAVKNILTGHSVDRKELDILDTEKSLTNLVSNVVIHQGLEAVRSIIYKIIREHKDENFYGYTGVNGVISAWDKIFSRAEVNELNRIIKDNKIICVGVFPKDFASDAFKEYGKGWAMDYEGRTAATNYVDKKYFANTGQMFAFRDAMYLMSLKDKLVIEIRHNDIQKMILSMYQYMRDTSDSVDINEELRILLKTE